MTQIAHPTPRRGGRLLPMLGLALAACLAVVAYGLAHHGGSAPRPAAPVEHTVTPSAGWRATPQSVRSLVAADLGATTTVPRYGTSNGLDRVRAVTCARGMCAVAYNADYTPALHTLGQLEAQQGAVFAGIFRDPTVRGVALTAWGPTTSAGTVTQNPVFELDCSRADVRGLDLFHASAPQLRSHCALVPYVH